MADSPEQLRGFARTKREEAAKLRRVARALSLDDDRERLTRQAEQVELEAERLEAEAERFPLVTKG